MWLETPFADSSCRKCIEAFVAENRVYCGAYGSFFPINGKATGCKAFSPALALAAIVKDLDEMEAGSERTAVCEGPAHGK